MSFKKGDLVIRIKQDFMDKDGNVIRGIVDPSDSIMPTYWIRIRCEDGRYRWYDVDELEPDVERIREIKFKELDI